ncbi:MAG: FtsW/RodA/SpoVE family cell cycle protein [Clostridiales bacterium]|nr:FtsW/RodA/SpoVE family cell cycle protein [Candidatus Cacconaster stercorequi]
MKLRRTKEFIVDIMQQADLVLLALCCAATGFGIVMISSATRYMDTWKLVIVQTCAAILGIGLYFVVSMVDLNELAQKWKWLTVFNIGFILLLVTPLGMESNGNRAWLHFPGFPVNVQPAEIVKLTFTIVLAWQLAWLKKNWDLKSIRSIAFLGVHLLVIIGLYYKVSGDMGSALVYVFIFACMAFVAGVAARWFILGGAAAGIGFFLLWEEDLIPDYMKARFTVLFDHSYDVRGVGWHQTRSLLALGGGGVTGQGLFHGTQTQSPYSGSLPFRQTDFIFSVIGEELGLIGCLAAIGLIVAIIIRCLVVANSAKTPLETYICVGMAAMLAFQLVINTGMCMFVMPVIGLTLPFFSYGGSSIVTLFLAMGMVSGIQKRSRPEWLRE